MPFKRKSFSTVGIVGFGAFGALVARHLAPHCRVLAFDLQPRDPEGLPVIFCDLPTVARSDVLVLAVPVSALADTIRTLRPHLQPGTIVIDVGSVKIEPVRIMREELPPFVEIIGTHPLFGPQSAKDGVAGHRIAWCPVRGRSTGRIAAFLRRVLELDVIRTTPDAHDREMAVVQGLTHLIAKVLVRMEPLPSRMATRSFDLILQATDMVRHDAPGVYEAIERANPHAAAVRERFFALADEVRGALDEQAELAPPLAAAAY
ncbi:MAG: prephenate dehydrogenase [Alphaproteobacteria bacterium 64-6]|nr:MAG: prephenate dehydrogenase [Alphaproteobacteria bacterium 64-6]